MNKLMTYFLHFGELLQKAPEGIQLDLISAISPTLVDCKSHEFQNQINEYILDAAVNGQLPVVFCQLMKYTTSYQLYQDLLNLNNLLTTLNSDWGMEMVSLETINILITHLNPNDLIFISSDEKVNTSINEVSVKYDSVRNVTFDFILKLLEIYKNISTKHFYKTPALSKDALISLDVALKYYLKIKSDKYKRIRNELTHLILLLMEVFSVPDAVQSGLAKDMLQLSVATEINDSHESKVFGFQLSATDIDLEFKKCLILSSTFFVQAPGIAKVVKDVKFFQGLLKIVYPLGKNPSISWTSAQWKEITEMVFTVIPVIIPHFPMEFVSLELGEKLIAISRQCAEQMDLETLLHCMKALAATCNDITGNLKINLIKHDVIPFLIVLTTKLLEEKELTQKKQAIVLHVITLLHVLILNEHNNFKMHKSSLFNLTLTLITNFIVLSDQVSSSNICLLILTVDIIRECVRKSYQLKKKFLEKGGIFLILDLTEVAPFLVKIVCLGLLTDIILRGDCIPHMLMWRGDQARGGRGLPVNKRGVGEDLLKGEACTHEVWLLPLLMRIWRMEEDNIGVLRLTNGVIKDIRAPLMGKDQRIWLTSEVKQIAESFSIAEICGSTRPKIYCIISLLNYHWKNKAKWKISTFEDYINTLDRNDQTTLKLVENYPYMKMGEKWLEIQMKLQDEDSFSSTIEIICKRNILWAQAVYKEQKELQLEGTGTELEKEMTAYEYIKRAHLAPELEIKRELQFQARTSNVYFLEKAKSCQEKEINQSLKFPNYTKKHRTYSTRAKTTVIAPHIHFN